MALWSNTSDGWAKDPSSSGNGALASYLQTASASAPKSQSATQTQDPSNSAPTSSVARTVIPTPVTQTAPTAPVVQPTQTVVHPVVQALTTPVAQTAVPQTASKVTADIAVKPTFVAPTPVTNTVTFSGPQVVIGYVPSNGGINTQFSKWDDASQSYKLVGSWNGKTGDFIGANGVTLHGQEANEYTESLMQQRQKFATGGDASNDAFAAGANSAAYGNAQNAAAITAYKNSVTATASQNQANLTTATNTQQQQYYLDYATSHNGQLPPAADYSRQLDHGANDKALRAAALQDYQTNKQSAAVVNQGMVPVDTTTQDSANQASLAALGSRFSTDNYGNNVGQVGRLFASAMASQSGTNQQLSDEDYAARFDQNQAAFQAAVANQATLDTNATGTKLQSDINAIGDGIATLQTQVSQLNTQSGQAVNAKLQDLQKKINEYNEEVTHHGNDTSFAIQLAKGIFTGVAAVTSIVLAPATGGASVAAGAAAVSAAS